MKRFRSAITILDQKELYTEKGWWLFSQLKNAYEALYQEEHRLIESYDTSNQGYIFSYAKFVELNPLR